MNILILNWKDIKNPEKGGAEIIAFEFARRLVKEGNNVTILSRKYKGCLNKETIDGVEILRKGNKLTVYWEAFIYYIHLKNKPDKIVDMVNTICWQTPLYVPKKNRVVYINQLAKEVSFYELPKPISILAYYLEKFEYIAYKNSNFICYSKSTKNDLVTFGINERNIDVFSLGLDHSRYKKLNNKTDYPLFIFIARLVKMKRADLCIKAMSLVINKYPLTKLVIVGNGPDEKRLRSLVNKYKLFQNVDFINKNNFFIDKTKNDIKLNLMQKAWCILLPSVKEGWGMVITEAAACGTPSIVSNVTGLQDSVINGKTGIILSANPTVEEMSIAMQKIIEDSDMRNKLSKEAFLWSKNFSWEKSYIEFKNLITRI